MANNTAAAVDTSATPVSAYALFVRWLVTLHLIALAAQLASAISFVGGWAPGAMMHMHNARLVGVLGLLQAIVIVSLPAARLKTPYRVFAVAALVGEASQLFFGITHGFGVHVTTAILLWAFSVAVSIKVWAPTWKQAS
jgi:hypothetical protein